MGRNKDLVQILFMPFCIFLRKQEAGTRTPRARRLFSLRDLPKNKLFTRDSTDEPDLRVITNKDSTADLRIHCLVTRPVSSTCCQSSPLLADLSVHSKYAAAGNMRKAYCVRDCTQVSSFSTRGLCGAKAPLLWLILPGWHLHSQRPLHS